MKNRLILLGLLIAGIGGRVCAQRADTTIHLRSVPVMGDHLYGYNYGEIKQQFVWNNPSLVNVTTVDVLQRIPSLTAGIEGDFLFRGAARPGVLLNGVPYGFLEEYSGDIFIQLPATFFNFIRLTSYPPVQWLPDGEGGTLNLISNPYPVLGSPSQVTLGGGLHNRWNAGFVLRQDYEDLQVEAKYDYRKEYRKRTYTKSTTTPTGTTELNNNADARPDIHMADLLLKYRVNPANTLSGYGFFQHMDYDRYGKIDNTRKGPEGNITNHIFRHRNNTQKQNSYAIEGRWNHTFSYLHDLEFIANYNNFGYDEENNYQNEKPETGAILAEDNLFVTHDKKNYYLSAVYRNIQPEQWSFTGGYTARIRKEDYKSLANTKVDGIWLPNTSGSSSYDFDLQTHTLFAEGGYHFSRLLRGEVGLQAEYAYRNMEPSSDSYSRFHLYPRAKLDYRFNRYSSQHLSLSYVQRVIRPYGMDLNDYTDRSDATHITRGNPGLKDEYIHNLELGYSGVEVPVTIYYRKRTNRILEVAFESDGQTIWQKENTGSSHTIGLEIMYKYIIAGNYQVGLSGNVFRDQIDGRVVGYGEKKSRVSGDIKGFLGFQITRSTELHLDAFYLTDQLTAQGKIKSRYAVNAAIRQYLYKDKLLANLSIHNIFDSLTEVTVIDTETLKMHQERNRDPRVVWLSLAYEL